MSAIVGLACILPCLCIFVPPNLPVEIIGSTIFIVYFGVLINTVLSSYYWLAVWSPNLSCVVQVCCVLYSMHACVPLFLPPITMTASCEGKRSFSEQGCRPEVIGGEGLRGVCEDRWRMWGSTGSATLSRCYDERWVHKEEPKKGWAPCVAWIIHLEH